MKKVYQKPEIIDEIWKDIPGYPKHQASSNGKVRNKETGKILKGWSTKAKHYRYVKLAKNKKLPVHQLVLSAFVCTKPFEDAQVNHIDGDPSNNRLCNLEWCTPQQNMDHAKATGLVKKGSKFWASKLDSVKARKIHQLRKAGYTLTQLATMFGVAKPTICNVLAGRSWKHI